MLTEIAEEDRGLIEEYLAAIRNTGVALSSILQSLYDSRKVLDTIFTELSRRLSMHRQMALEKVLYVMKHDFVRGWEIIEERTLPYVCTSYKTAKTDIRRVFDELRLGNETDHSVREAIWFMQDRELQRTLDLASRARDNITEVYVGYKTGKPLLKFRTTRNRRYDLSYITVELLQEIVDDANYDQDAFYNNTLLYLDQLEAAVKEYRRTGQRLLHNLTWNDGEVRANEKRYDKACQNYNYNIFLTKSRIVDAPVNIMNKRIADFDRLNRTLYETLDALDLMKYSLVDVMRGQFNSSWGVITNCSKMALNYLIDPSTRKTDLANLIAGTDIQEHLTELGLFFQDLRSRGRTLDDTMTILQQQSSAMWKNLLDEYTTSKFYAHVQSDFREYVDNPDRRGFLRPYFAFLLGRSSDFIGSLSNKELEYRLNADLYGMDRAARLADDKALYDTLQRQTNIASKLGSLDEEFEEKTAALRHSLATYKQTSAVNRDFYM